MTTQAAELGTRAERLADARRRFLSLLDGGPGELHGQSQRPNLPRVGPIVLDLRASIWLVALGLAFLLAALLVALFA